MQPQPSQPAPNALVVRTDRAAIDRAHRVPLILSSVLLALCLAAIVTIVALLSGSAFAPTTPLLSLAPFVLVTISSALQIGAGAFTWGARRSIEEVLVADEAGLRMQTSGGVVQVPWRGVRGARLAGSGRRSRLTLQLTLDEARTTLTPRDRDRIARRGFPIGAIGIEPGLDAIANAVAVGTQGRVQAQRA